MPNSSHSTPGFWERNLAALRRAYPEWALQVECASTEHVHLEPALSPPFHACRLMDHSGIPLRRGRDGWIHGPSHPRLEVQEIMARIARQESDLFVLVQAGLGHVLHSLCERLTRIMLQRGREPLLVAHEEDFGVFRKCLELRAWENIIESPRVLLLLGKPFRQSLADLAQTHPAVFVRRHPVLCPGSHLAEEEALSLAEIGRAIQEQSVGYDNQLVDRYKTLSERLVSRPAQPKSRAQPRVVLFSHYFPSIQRQFQKGFRQLGWECELVSWPREEQFIRRWLWLDILERFNPDLFLFLNESPEEIAETDQFASLPAPKIVWFYDDPLRSMDYPPRPLRRGEKDAVIGFDRTFLPFLSSIGFPRVATLPPATGFTQETNAMESNKKQITYVGNLPAAGVRFFEDGFLRLTHPDFLPIIEEGTKNLLAQPEQSLMEWLEAHLPPDCGICRRHFYVTIQDKATWRRRRSFLEPLADLGLSLYGPHTWRDPDIAGPLARNYAGRTVDYDTELPQIYAHSKINLNLFHTQCRWSINPRVYDVLACGGLLLTDDNPGLHDDFVDGKHLVVARSPEEMREKAIYYLNHPKERIQIAEAGRQRVLERHTYRHRLQQMLDIAGLSQER